MNRFSNFILISALGLLSTSAMAGTFDVLPFPTPEYANSGANAVSRDGTTVVGYVTDILGNSYPACWTGNNLITLGSTGEWKYVSGNGHVLAGIIGNAPQISINDVISNLGGPVSDTYISNGVGEGISSDGLTVFGQNPATSAGQSFRIPSASYANYRQCSASAFEQIRSTSADAQVLVGDSLDANHRDWPAYWALGIAHYAPLLSGFTQGMLSFSNDQGSLLFGTQYNSATSAWHYTVTADARTLDLGAQPGLGIPAIVSASNDGDVFVAMSGGAPIIWTRKEGYVQPSAFFNEHNAGVGSYTIDSLNGVSADGTIFTGTCSPNNSITAPIYAFVATVDPYGYPTISKLNLASSSVVGGKTVLAGLILNHSVTFPISVAVAAGDGPLANAFVVVPAGRSSVDFTLLTQAVTANKGLTLTATLGASTANAPITLAP